MMKLVEPTLKYKDTWLAAIKELNNEGAKGFWNVPTYPTDINEYIERTQNHSQGKDLPDYWVPATTYWLIDDEKFVGHVNVRHELTDKLKIIGGHIGYYIRPTERRKGYGYKILGLALIKAHELGLKKVMITCNDDNVGSIKVIERNGGILKDKVQTEEEGLVRHYWIESR